MNKTYLQKPAEVKRAWHLMDAKGQVLGQFATQLAVKLMGKNKPTFTSHVDGGDCVVVVNAKEVVATGTKEQNKIYYNYSGFPGGLRKRSLGVIRKTNPTEIIKRAVYNMLPKNKLRPLRMKRLKIYADETHPHQAHFSK